MSYDDRLQCSQRVFDQALRRMAIQAYAEIQPFCLQKPVLEGVFDQRCGHGESMVMPSVCSSVSVVCRTQ